MADLIAWASVGASTVLFLAGMYEIVISWRTNGKVRAAADKATTTSQSVADDTTLEAQSGIDFKGQWEALAALATALKDLDRSTRLLLLSLAFMAVAAATVGISDVAAAVAST